MGKVEIFGIIGIVFFHCPVHRDGGYWQQSPWNSIQIDITNRGGTIYFVAEVCGESCSTGIDRAFDAPGIGVHFSLLACGSMNWRKGR